MDRRIIIGIVLIIAIISSAFVLWYVLQEEEPTVPTHVCGDGICDADYENAENCPGDCGCNDNGICEPERGETAENCPDCKEDPEICDGDGICEEGETPQNCDDCGCDDDGICESERGETRYNCEDCVERPPSGTGLSWELPNLDKKVGDEFWLEVSFTPTSGQILGFYILDMTWDSNVLQYVHHEGVGVWETWFWDGYVSSGLIDFCQSMNPEGSSTKTTLLRVKVKAVGAGSASLSFADVQLGDTSATDFDSTSYNINTPSFTIYG